MKRLIEIYRPLGQNPYRQKLFGEQNYWKKSNKQHPQSTKVVHAWQRTKTHHAEYSLLRLYSCYKTSKQKQYVPAGMCVCMFVWELCLANPPSEEEIKEEIEAVAWQVASISQTLFWECWAWWTGIATWSREELCAKWPPVSWQVKIYKSNKITAMQDLCNMIFSTVTCTSARGKTWSVQFLMRTLRDG